MNPCFLSVHRKATDETVHPDDYIPFVTVMITYRLLLLTKRQRSNVSLVILLTAPMVLKVKVKQVSRTGTIRTNILLSRQKLEITKITKRQMT